MVCEAFCSQSPGPISFTYGKLICLLVKECGGGKDTCFVAAREQKSWLGTAKALMIPSAFEGSTAKHWYTKAVLLLQGLWEGVSDLNQDSVKGSSQWI